jgi:hypothetical protein
MQIYSDIVQWHFVEKNVEINREIKANLPLIDNFNASELLSLINEDSPVNCGLINMIATYYDISPMNVDNLVRIIIKENEHILCYLIRRGVIRNSRIYIDVAMRYKLAYFIDAYINEQLMLNYTDINSIDFINLISNESMRILSNNLCYNIFITQIFESKLDIDTYVKVINEYGKQYDIFCPFTVNNINQLIAHENINVSVIAKFIEKYFNSIQTSLNDMTFVINNCFINNEMHDILSKYISYHIYDKSSQDITLLTRHKIHDVFETNEKYMDRIAELTRRDPELCSYEIADLRESIRDNFNDLRKLYQELNEFNPNMSLRPIPNNNKYIFNWNSDESDESDGPRLLNGNYINDF